MKRGTFIDRTDPDPLYQYRVIWVEKEGVRKEFRTPDLMTKEEIAAKWEELTKEWERVP